MRTKEDFISLRASGIARSAASSFDALIKAGVEPYDRHRHLPRILPIDSCDLADVTIAGRRKTLARLARALRAERKRGRAGHWTYDLNRHIALAQAHAAEQRLLGLMASAAD